MLTWLPVVAVEAAEPVAASAWPLAVPSGKHRTAQYIHVNQLAWYSEAPCHAMGLPDCLILKSRGIISFNLNRKLCLAGWGVQAEGRRQRGMKRKTIFKEDSNMKYQQRAVDGVLTLESSRLLQHTHLVITDLAQGHDADVVETKKAPDLHWEASAPLTNHQSLHRVPRAQHTWQSSR